jgi:PilZ domain
MTTQWPAPSSQKVDQGRRGSPRRRIDLAGWLQGRSRRAVTVVDLSLTGCLVRGSAALDRGTILDLRLELSPRPIEVKVRVAGSSVEGESMASGSPHYLTGLEFLGLPAGAAARLRRFLAPERRRRGGALPPSP